MVNRIVKEKGPAKAIQRPRGLTTPLSHGSQTQCKSPIMACTLPEVVPISMALLAFPF
jgi:hypothetical protein